MTTLTMSTAEHEGQMTLPDGRAASYALLGAAGGPLVVVLDGPGSRGLARAMAADAVSAGVRLLAPDRPGFFGSDPHRGATVTDWPRDLAVMLDHLGAGRVGLAAQSGGTPFALAAAVALEQRIAAVSLLGPVAPFDVRGALRDVRGPLRTAIPIARRAPWLLRRLLGAASKQAARDLEKVAAKATRDLPPVDAEMMRDPAMLAMHVRATGEILSRPDALADEMRLIARPWGVDPASVNVPVAIWVGDGDATHPPVMSRRLAAQIGGDVAVTVIPDAATFGLASHYPEALRFATS